MIRKLSDRLLRFFIHPDYYPDIKGDLEELSSDPESKPISDWRYLWEVILLMRPALMRSFIPSFTSPRSSNHLSMIRNYILIAFRQINRNRGYSLINISGFSIGIASCIIIFFYVRNETSFDKFHDHSEDIYKVTTYVSRSSGDSHYSQTPPALAPALKNDLPEIQKYARLRVADQRLFANGDKKFYEDGGFFVDSTFLEIFDFKLEEGNESTALDRPNTMVISREMADKYFGNQSPIGQQLVMDNEQSFEVTGVLAPIPPNSHIKFDLLMSFRSFRVPEGYLADLNSWGWIGFETYIHTHDGVSISDLESKLSKLYSENLQSRTGLVISAKLQPLEDIYLGSAEISGAGNEILFLTGDKRIISGLSAIAILILLIACINFTNLSTALSLRRGREIGVRKSLGAVRGKLVFQFILESVLMGLLSLTVTFILLMLVDQIILNSLELSISLNSSLLIQYFPYFMGGVILVSIIAGIYPSLIMSGFDPITALKGKLGRSSSKNWFQKGLIVFQFAISVSLIAGSMIIIYQLNFMRSSSLGYEKERVLLLTMPPAEVPEYHEVILNTLKSNPDVISVTNHNNLQQGTTASSPIRLKGQQEDESIQIDYYGVDYEFLNTLGINLKQGRFFSPEIFTDSTQAIVINESAARILGLDNPVGEEVVFIDGANRKVIGVVEDFHFLSLHQNIGPLVMVIPFTNIGAFMIKMSPGDPSRQIAKIEQDWKTIVPHLPFDFSFLDSNLSNMYDKERKLGKLIPVFSILAVCLACLGLYGLVALNMQSRTKEIGIRKVLGSSVQEIMVLLSKQYIGIILVSISISVPVTWYLSNQWLSDFAYHINVKWWMFGISGLILVFIAMVTILNQLLSAARNNPVDVLKTE